MFTDYVSKFWPKPLCVPKVKSNMCQKEQQKQA
jgi:hypothetical protein